MSGMLDLTPTVPTTSAIMVFSEDHSGTVSGGKFNTQYAYAPGTVRLYIQGIRLRPGIDNDYIESQPALGEITLLGQWAEIGPSDAVLVDYNRV